MDSSKVRAASHVRMLVCAAILSVFGAQASAQAPAPVAAEPAAPDTTAQAESAPAVQTPAEATPVPTPAQVAAEAPVAAEPASPSAAPAPEAPKPVEAKKDPQWYEKIKLRGYTQFRYNRLPSFNENDKLVNAQGDKTIGANNGISIRRARLILYGDVHERVSIYLQPDFASSIDDQLGVAILRDWYADIFLDSKKEFRLRVGQSKVPYGFENMQSSQNRLPLDRNDALNSAVKDERDMGVFFYWAPEEIRARFKHLVDSGLKGSGDYGVVALGVYNGQTANRPAAADDVHTVGRVTWPFKFGEQFVELSTGGYFGKFYVKHDEEYSAEVGKVKDARAHATVVVYPQPFGFAAEGTYGVGPSLGDRGDSDETVIKSRELFGGYAQLMYKIDDVLGTVSMVPFARATYYDGGKKFETNAPHYLVKELELGLEWQLIKNLEMVLAYDMAERTNSKSYEQEKGHVTRVQVQVNY